MKRFYSSMFAVVLLMGVFALLHAQEARISVPLGWYSLPEFAQALSTPERKVVCRADLSQRVALVHLKERSWEEVRALVQEVGLRLEPSGQGRWRLEWLPSVEMRERRWRVQIAQEQDRQLSERMRQIREKVPVLPERFWDEYRQLSRDLEKYLWEEDDSGALRFNYEKMESFDLAKWAISPEIVNWARKVAQFVVEDIGLAFTGSQVKDPVEYRTRFILTFHQQTMEYHLWYAVARLAEEPAYRLSFLEMYEQGYSLRVVPFTTLLEKLPEVRILVRAFASLETSEGAPPVDSNRLKDLYLVYYLRSAEDTPEPLIYLSVISSEQDKPITFGSLPLLSAAARGELANERGLWERVQNFYQPVWQEARSYVEQAQRATETALEHPALQQPFDSEGLVSASWSRWVHQWAKQTGNEVLMLWTPSQDPVLQTRLKMTLAESYRQGTTPRERFAPAWLTLQMREGVLIADVLNGCITRLQDYPLASLKQLFERQNEWDYKDYLEYYRSVSPQQNRWWFMRAWRGYKTPFEQSHQQKSPSESGRYVVGSLWFGMYLIEHLPEALRKELLEKGELQVDLMRVPERVRRELAGLIRSAFTRDPTTTGLWHPLWLLRTREYSQEESEGGMLSIGDYPLLTIRAEQEPMGEGRARLRLRFAPNPSSVIGEYFAFDTFETPYNRWLFEIRRSAN